MNNIETPRTKTALQKRETKRIMRGMRRKRRDSNMKVKKNHASLVEGNDDHDEHEKAEVEKKVMALKRIVPGGESLVGIDKLFEETAGYIMKLQCQVKAMKVLASFFEGLEKENMKVGG